MKVQKMVSHTGLYSLGNLMRQFVGFIMLPIYTQYLTPEDYGSVALISFAIIVFESVFGARLMAATQRFYHLEEDEGKRKVVFSTALITTLSFSLILVLGLIFAREPIAEFLFDSGDYSFIFALFALQTLTQAIEYYGLLYLRLQDRPLAYVWINLAKLALQLSLNVWLIVFLELGVLGIAISGLVATLTTAVCLAVYSCLRNGVAYDYKVAVALLRFSWPLWLSGLAVFYTNASSSFYLKEYASLHDVGLFDLAARFGAILYALVWAPFELFWNNERFLVQKTAEAMEVIASTFVTLQKLLLGGTIVISLLAPPVIIAMADPSFHPAASIVPLICLALCLRAYGIYFHFGFVLSGNTGYITMISYASAVLVTVLFLVIIPKFGLAGAAASAILVELVAYTFAYNASKKFLGTHPVYFGSITRFLFAAIFLLSTIVFLDVLKISALADLLARLTFIACGLILLIGFRDLKRFLAWADSFVSANFVKWRS